QALNYFKQSVAHYNTSGADWELELAEAWMGIADCHVQLGHVQQAEKNFERALDLAISGTNGPNRDVAEIYVAWGNLLLTHAQPEKALHAFHRAVMQTALGFNDTARTALPDSSHFSSELWLIRSLERKAAAFEAIGKTIQDRAAAKIWYDHALACYSLAFSFMDEIRMGFSGRNARTFLSGFAYPVYERAIRLTSYMWQKYFNEGYDHYVGLAFEYIERSKTNAILESLTELESQAKTKLPDSVFIRGRSFETRLARLRAAGAPADSILAVKKQQEGFLKELEQNHPQFDALRSAFHFVSPAEVEKNLKDGTVFLEYFMGDSSIFVICIGNGPIRMKELTRTDNFDRHLATFRGLISRVPEAAIIDAQYKAFAESGLYLYGQLIFEVMHDPTDIEFGFPKRFIIVPDGRLAFIPFESLPLGTPDPEGNFYTFPYLVRESRVSYAHAASILLNNTLSAEPRPSARALILAPERTDLPPLPFAKQEAEQVEGSFGGDVLLGETATESDFKATAANYAVIHLAAHAVADNKNPLNSGIYLHRSPADDGLLHPWELFSHPLHSDLAVLSACETGMGKVVPGEGVLSIARAFRMAGCHSIIMSLWLLEDQDAASIMTEFYKSLAKGQSVGDAFHKARLHYLENADNLRSHPYFWAPFVQIGRSDIVFEAVGPSKGFSGWLKWGLLALALLLGAAIAIWRLRDRKSI
ncbi:MAG: CHAT domain-containing tetratricopeptide repeat protein, partial [Bacteroidota bacterium]